MQNAALLALLYLEGSLAPDCPLVTFAAAGEMAQVGGGPGEERERSRACGTGVPASHARRLAL